MGDDTNLPILCPQVRKTCKFKTLLLELRTGNYVVVTNLQIYHPTFYLLCDAGTDTLQTVFLFFQLPYCWVHQFWGLMEPKGWKSEKGIDSLNCSFYRPTVLNCSIHNWFLSSAYFRQSKTSLFIAAQQYPYWLRHALSSEVQAPALEDLFFKLVVSLIILINLFHLLSLPQGSSCFLKSLFILSVYPYVFLNSLIPT